jgi:hypothetical protein
MNEQDFNEEAQGAKIDILIIDIEVFARENKKPPVGHKYRVKIGHEYFVFDHHIVTGKQLLEKACLEPVECHTLYKYFHKGDFRRIGLHDEVDLAAHGVEHFVVKPPEVYHYMVDTAPESTEEKELTPNQILMLADITPIEDYYLVEILPDGQQISFKGKGNEPIKMRCPGLKFVSAFNGETPVS